MVSFDKVIRDLKDILSIVVDISYALIGLFLGIATFLITRKKRFGFLWFSFIFWYSLGLLIADALTVKYLIGFDTMTALYTGLVQTILFAPLFFLYLNRRKLNN